LATVGRVLAVDYVGVGDSDQPEDGFQYSVEEQADILSGFIEALGLSRVTVVGASYGGAVALNMAAHYPELVASVVSIEGGALVIPEILQYGSWGKVIEWPILGQITWAFMQSGLFDRLASRSIMGSSWERLTPEEQADITGIVTANIRTLTRAAWIRMYRVITGRIDFVQDLKQSQVPILYLYGSESRYRAMSEANVQELQELRNVDTLRIEGGIHDLHLQYPVAMTQLILDFLGLPQARGPIAGLANPLGLSGKEMEERGVR
jgi:pimeloyl-ACP methyl ester carboxylesterase